ncbi:MAG: hypothetical protein RL042_117 [Nitrospirota bacterium]|jgi:hypothetical protein
MAVDGPLVLPTRRFAQNYRLSAIRSSISTLRAIGQRSLLCYNPPDSPYISDHVFP